MYLILDFDFVFSLLICARSRALRGPAVSLIELVFLRSAGFSVMSLSGTLISDLNMEASRAVY